MKPKVYVETTILSYLAARPSRQPVTAGRQVITRQWWANERKTYNLVVSEVVEAESDVVMRNRLRAGANCWARFRFSL